jgi:hypothetical protein
MKLTLFLVLAIAGLTGIGILASGCGTKSVKASTPGQLAPVNDFENYAYQVLLDTQAGLADADAKIKSGELPKSLTPDYDRAAVLYNTSIALLKRYDAAYRAGSSVDAIQIEIAQDLGDLMALGLKMWPNKIKAAPAPPATK